MEQNAFQSVSQFLSSLNLNRSGPGKAIDVIVSRLQSTGQEQQEVEDRLLEIAYAMKRYKEQLQWQLEIEREYRELQIGVLDHVRPLLLNVRYIDWDTWRIEILSKRDVVLALAQSLRSPNTLRVKKLGIAELQTLVEEVLPEVDDLIEKVRNADVDIELKQVLYNALNLVRRAIENYSMIGTEGLIEAIQESRLFFDRYRDISDPVEDEIPRDLIKETLSTVGRVVTLVKTAGWPKPIAESSLLALPVFEQLNKLP